MQHLIEIVKSKASLSEEQSKAAVEAMMAEFKQKFPGFLHSELDNIASGGDFGDSAREKFDRLRDKLEEAAKSAGEKAETFAEEVRNKFSEMFGDKGKGNKQ
ncbi:MAG: hypothetical protein EYC69_10155 [Bacteroidetes bacterium]|nr:MAG: hypothetical protein EYC69_10155 [Bacteroidota bacterium]